MQRSSTMTYAKILNHPDSLTIYGGQNNTF